MTHYDTLGVRPGATPEEIRNAYRRLARQHHPDRSAAPAGSMAAINEAYRVLRDPGRRALYDAGHRSSDRAAAPPASTSAGSTGATRPHVVAAPPSRYPWGLVVGMAVVGVAIVLVGAVLREPAEEPAPDNLLGPGSCVQIEANGDAGEVRCSADHLVVVELVAFDGTCPVGTEAHRDRQGRGLACVAARAPAVTS